MAPERRQVENKKINKTVIEQERSKERRKVHWPGFVSGNVFCIVMSQTRIKAEQGLLNSTGYEWHEENTHTSSQYVVGYPKEGRGGGWGDQRKRRSSFSPEKVGKGETGKKMKKESGVLWLLGRFLGHISFTTIKTSR